jgi:hypothetical protein
MVKHTIDMGIIMGTTNKGFIINQRNIIVAWINYLYY